MTAITDKISMRFDKQATSHISDAYIYGVAKDQLVTILLSSIQFQFWARDSASLWS
jgi:hypothetical protein